MVRLVIFGMSARGENVACALTPAEGDRRDMVLIWMPRHAAQAVTWASREQRAERPIGSDLLLKALEETGCRIKACEICGMREGTWFSHIVVIRPDGSEFTLDARPSDALIVALRTGVGLGMDEELYETQRMRDDEDEEHAEELERFHEFIESVSADDFSS
jgi:hypothetical protein